MEKGSILSLVVLWIGITLCMAIEGTTLYLSGDDDEYPDYEYPDYDHCDPLKSIHDLTDNALTCQHTDFNSLRPINDREKYSNQSIYKPCCGNHGYLFADNCEERVTHSHEVCTTPGEKPFLPLKVNCPLDCRMINIQNPNFVVQENGTIRLNGSLHREVHDFCVAFKCVALETLEESHGWEPFAKACVCFSNKLWNQAQSQLKKYDSLFHPSKSLDCNSNATLNDSCVEDLELNNLKGCCKSGSDRILTKDHFPKAHRAKVYNDSYTFCTEPLSHDEKLEEDKYCKSKSWKYRELSKWSQEGLSILNKKGDVVLKRNGTTNFSFDVNSNHYCVGVALMKLDLNGRKTEKVRPVPVIKYCVPHCEGRFPCISICADCPQYQNEPYSNNIVRATKKCNDSTCQCMMMHENVTKTLFGKSEDSLFPEERLFTDFQNHAEKGCKKGFRVKRLKPKTKCNDRYYLTNDGNLVVNKTPETTHKRSEYCIEPNGDANSKDDHFATICVKEGKFASWKPYLLIASSIFLVITVGIYTWFHKLLNYYSRIMRHFAIALLAAFVVLSIIQWTTTEMISWASCKALGFLAQYFFLVAFALMTTMSLELWRQITGYPANQKRYRRMMGAGYLVPTIISVCTLITEYAAPNCASFRPRFGEGSCFFAEWKSKFIWFHIPMTIGILINICVSSFIVYTLCQHDSQKKTLRLDKKTQENTRKENIEKLLTYMKLFLGFGFVWSFEIINGLAEDSTHESAWYFTDVLNMIQPVYVFIIFVLKRNVMNMIRGRDQKRGTRSTRKSKKSNLNKKMSATEMTSLKSGTTGGIEMTPIRKNTA